MYSVCKQSPLPQAAEAQAATRATEASLERDAQQKALVDSMAACALHGESSCMTLCPLVIAFRHSCPAGCRERMGKANRADGERLRAAADAAHGLAEGAGRHLPERAADCSCGLTDLLLCGCTQQILLARGTGNQPWHPV